MTRWLQRLLLRVGSLKANQEIFVFSIFLVTSIVFWFSQTFKDQTSVNVDYTLQISNVPKKVIFTSDLPSTVNASISGKGFAVLQYLFNHQQKTIKVDYGDLPKMGGMISIDNYVWKKAFAKQLPAGVTFQSVNPSPVEIYYSMGEHRQVPVEFIGKIRTSDEYLLCDIEVQPDYVDIYAPNPLYDTITVVPTEQVEYHEVEDTFSFRVALQAPRGVKLVPDSVQVKACVDLFTTKTLKVPIYCENIPHNRILRTFPLMAEVTFRVSASRYNYVMAPDFIIVVDYSAIRPSDRKCKLIIRELPKGIYNVRLTPEEVDYVIEQED